MIGHVPLDTSPTCVTVIGPVQLSASSVTTVTSGAGTSAIHATVTGAGLLAVGGISSLIVMICVNTLLIFPHTSVAIHVFVYVPACGQEPGTNAPEVFIYAIVPVQLSVAAGASACAAANPTASLHCNVTFNAPGVVVHVGAIKSTILIVAGDSLHPAIVLAVPAAVVPHTALVTYFTFILYPLQLLVVGGVFPPHVTPSSKLYSIVNPVILAGGVTVNNPHPGVTTGAVGAAGNITVLTVLLTPHAPEPAVPAVVAPQVAVNTYCAVIE